MTQVNSGILIGLGANLPGPAGRPEIALPAAMARLEELGVGIVARSRLWRSRPVPDSDQPWFVNAVVAVESGLTPAELLALLHRVEAEFGRVRSVPNAARILDLDLLAHGRRIDDTGPPVLPHPRLGDRAFVLFPLAEVMPLWCHPVSGQSIAALIEALPPGQTAEPIG